MSVAQGAVDSDGTWEQSQPRSCHTIVGRQQIPDRHRQKTRHASGLLIKTWREHPISCTGSHLLNDGMLLAIEQIPASIVWMVTSMWRGWLRRGQVKALPSPRHMYNLLYTLRSRFRGVCFE